MSAPARRKQRPPLDASALDEIALRYVGRFATTRAKLAAYLARKIRERGWGGEGEPDFAALADRLAGLGYVDDAAYAESRSRSLSGRGYGARRVRQSLRAAGVSEEDSARAQAIAEAERVEAALRFARRRRLGPFADLPADERRRERAIAAMVRAGHSFALSKAIVALQPGGDYSVEQLAEKR